VERLLKQIDLNSDDGIAYDEWMAAMLTWRTVRRFHARSATCTVSQIITAVMCAEVCPNAEALEVSAGC
jgi:hypothetical protein